MKSRDRAGIAAAVRAAAIACILPLGLLPAASAHAQSRIVGSFHVRPGTDTASHEDRSTASLLPRRARGGGMMMWQCVERGGLAVGVRLDGPRDGRARPLAWRFARDRPDTATVTGLSGEGIWYLPPEDVAPFTLRARQARRLVIDVPADGPSARAEYVYELDEPGPALDRLPCARTPVAGRPLRQDELGLAPPEDEGTYELAAIEVMPTITNAEEIQQLLIAGFPPSLRGTGITGRVVLRFRVLPSGRVDTATVEVVESSHEAFNEAAITAVGRLVLTPALVNNRPVQVWITLPLTFMADEAEPDSSAAPPPPAP